MSAITDCGLNEEVVLRSIYEAGGVRPSGYGYLSGGYGGGVEMEIFHQLRWLDGYLCGLLRGDRAQAHRFMREVNEKLIERFPDEVRADNAPFKNLDAA